MKLADPTAPYASLIKWVLIAVLAGFLFIGGCQRGKAVQAKQDAGRIAKLRGELGKAASALSAASVRFREIDAATAMALADSKAQEADAREAAKEAKRDNAAMQVRIAEINRQAERERTTCSQAEVAICGSLLR